MKYIEAGKVINIHGLNVIFRNDITEEATVKRITTLIEMLFKTIATDTSSKFIDKYLDELYDIGVIKMNVDDEVEGSKGFDPVGFYNLSSKVDTPDGYKLAIVRFAVAEYVEIGKLKPILTKISDIVTNNLPVDELKPELDSVNFTYFDLQNTLIVGENNIIINANEEYSMSIFANDLTKVLFSVVFSRELTGKEFNYVLTQLYLYTNKEINVFELKKDLISNYNCVKLNDIITPSVSEN